MELVVKNIIYFCSEIISGWNLFFGFGPKKAGSCSLRNCRGFFLPCHPKNQENWPSNDCGTLRMAKIMAAPPAFWAWIDLGKTTI